MKIAVRPAHDAPVPAVGHPARRLPSSRYRHPGDVIRLIGASLILIVSLAVVAVAPSQLVGTDASAVTWLEYDPAGRLLAAPGRDAAVAASVTVVAAVIALAPPGRRRTWWTLAAMAFSILMGLSRAYLGAHWLSDAVAGILLGISCAVVTALMIGQIQRRVEGRQGAA